MLASYPANTLNHTSTNNEIPVRFS